MDRYFILRLNKYESIINTKHVVLVVKYDRYTEFYLDNGVNYEVEDKDGSIFNKYFDLVGDPLALN